MSDNVVDFNAFKNRGKKDYTKHPFFTESCVLTLGVSNDENEQRNFVVISNLVEEGKQYLALREEDPSEESMSDGLMPIAIVEAIITNDQCTAVLPIDDEDRYEYIASAFEEILDEAFEEDESNDKPLH